MNSMNIEPYCHLQNDVYVYDFAKLDLEHKGILYHEHDNCQSFPLHRHEFFEVFFVENGPHRMIFNDHSFPMKENSLMIMNPNILHKPEIVNGTTRAYCISFNYNIAQRCITLLKESPFIKDFLVNGMQSRTNNKEYLYFEIHHDSLIKDIHSFIDTMQKEPYVREIAQAYLYLILAKLNEEKRLYRKNNTIKNTIETELTYYLESNLKNASLTDFQKIMNYSYERLSKLIRDETGSTFSDLLNRRRIEKICELLEHTDISIPVLLEIIGVKNRSYFEKKFMEQIHCSMKEYRCIKSE